MKIKLLLGALCLQFLSTIVIASRPITLGGNNSTWSPQIIESLTLPITNNLTDYNYLFCLIISYYNMIFNKEGNSTNFISNIFEGIVGNSTYYDRR